MHNWRKHRVIFAIGMTVLILGFIGIGLVNATETKSTQATWESLKKLATGQQIRVVLNDAKSYSGQFQKVSDDALVVRTGGGEQTFERQSILRVSTKGASHRGRNALIGLGIGAGVGALVGGTMDPHQEVVPGGAAAAAGLGVIFGGMGAGVGALIPTGGWHDVYRAR